MSKLLVLPYKTASKSAETVSGILGCLRMKVEGSSIRDLATTTIVNWGNSTTDLSQLPSVKVFNKPANVRTASRQSLPKTKGPLCLYAYLTGPPQ